MDQNIRIVVTGQSPARFAGIIKSLKGVDVSAAKLSDLGPKRKKDPNLIPELFVLSLTDQWEQEIHLFLTSCGSNTPTVIAIGPGENMDVMRAAMQAGAKDYLSEDVSKVELRASVMRQVEAIHKTKVAIDNQMIVTVSPKGSGESTFLTSNLAYINAILGDWRTAALDLDLQFGSLPLFLDLNLERSILGALESSDSLDATSLEAYMTRHKNGLFVAGVLEDDLVLPGEITVNSLEVLLDLLNNSFERVFVNLPLHISPLTSLVLAQADKIIVLVEQDIISLRRGKSLLTLLQRDLEIPRRKIEIVINRYENNQQITSRDIQKALGDTTIHTLPDGNSTVHESINTGVPMLRSAPKSPVTKSLLKLAEELNGEKFKRRPGLLGKAFSYITKH